MNARAYYNEIDRFAAEWLRNLIAAGRIAAGDVDERDIRDVRPDDLAGYDQCHFFAGIGGWSAALRIAGWPDDRPVWTGSCPCQPFSAAGKGKAADDERHLWPAWFPLIAKCSPPVVFGEQVEAAIGWGWLDAVFTDLEGQGYACGATDISAAGVGAPHIRQRVWWVADAAWRDQRRYSGIARGAADAGRGEAWPQDGDAAGGSSPMGRMADALRGGAEYGPGEGLGAEAAIDGEDRRLPWQRLRIEVESPTGELGPLSRWMGQPDGSRSLTGSEAATSDGHGSSLVAASWADCDWLPCRDGKARPVEPGTFPLAHGIPGRVGRLRAYGNAIVPQVAAEFIGAFLDSER